MLSILKIADRPHTSTNTIMIEVLGATCPEDFPNLMCMNLAVLEGGG